MDKVMAISTYLGNGGMVWIIIIALLMISKNYRRIGFMALAVLILSTILGDIVLGLICSGIIIFLF